MYVTIIKGQRNSALLTCNVKMKIKNAEANSIYLFASMQISTKPVQKKAKLKLKKNTANQ
ncbi:hypothetical protein KAM621c_17490 [Citrobacter braakii]|uniref:Uncharacterized protein n=1 Tax=Citrobacter braakii TaxID=57706 RepID=A0AAD1L0T3_CITBR|nr:hypothetical protein KAM621c_17490 [Citrobacter braakii]